jgi:predicted acyl esterase
MSRGRAAQSQEIRKREGGTWSIACELIPVPEGMIIEKDVIIKMRDGINLAANVYRPKKQGKFPVILAITPFSKDRGPDEYFKEFVEMHLFRGEGSIGKIRVSPITSFEAPDPAYWVLNDYIVVYVDARGAGKSEGRRGVRMEDEADYYDIIEWAGMQDWSNGNIGISGVSALAMAQYYAAAMHPPHLKAIIPWEGVSDDYRDKAFPGGIPETNFLSPRPGHKLDEAALAALFDPVKQQAVIASSAKLEQVVVPALICGSWSDQGMHNRGSFEAFRRFSSKDKWLYTHGGKKWQEYYCDEALEYQKKFFDFFLKGVDNGMLEVPRIRMEIRDTIDTYKVRYENEWPIARTEYHKLYLDPAGKLSYGKIQNEGEISYNSADGRAIFNIVFTKDIELSGYMKLKLSVSAGEADDMDLIIGVHKLDINDNEAYFYGNDGFIRGIVARGWLRVSQRKLDEEKSTPWQPYLKHEGEQKIKPGEIVPVEIPILPSSTLFHKGETLRLTIQGKDNIAYGRLRYERLVNKGKHTIYTGGKYDSYLQIPVIPSK